ncbi:hypothetical protein DENIS_3340 [Desulfonema ishimotonii]|uniref:YkgJ family cysteine cluster protein n=2 Tax=Desulfonema ishimotonii TaxID=45657 RepID=A0A401FZI1_9BACT|nr:hypothetical protein DENIS_3340 [Desulfonema ishimotonii]
MDQAWETAATHYGFHCDGCADNCCLTLFYHHTWLEYLCIREGFEALLPDVREAVTARAAEVRVNVGEAEKTGQPLRFMCPLNTDGLCQIYSHRPMICRLHGIAHELHPPGRDVVYGPGCGAFTAQTDGMDYFRFDRTPFYVAMSRLESELKAALGISDRIKMTIAEMIGTF